jgi:serine/threonine protein kinase
VQLASTIMNKDHEQEKHALFCKGIAQSKEALPFDMQINPQDIKVGKQIGKGTYGVVHEASWLGCKLVVKIIKSKNIHVLQKEVTILLKLRHPCIVLLVGFCVDDDRSMIVMERLDGDLRELIEKQGKNPPFPQHVAIGIISQIAAGMAYLHEKGIFHGDLKASNVLVTRHGAHIQAKITDFGVSQSMQFTSKQCETIMNGDHHPNSSDFGMYFTLSFFGIVGTTGWRAPEVFLFKVCLLFKQRLLYLLGRNLKTQMHMNTHN